MSSGACRALVAVVLTLATAIVMSLPVAANEDQLRETSIVTYDVDPDTGRVDATIQLLLTTLNRPRPAGEWGPVVVEKAAPAGSFEFVAASRVPRAEDVPGPGAPWQAIRLDIPRRIDNADNELVVVDYRFDAQVGNDESNVPARVDPSYVFLCVPGQDVDEHRVTIRVDGGGWSFSQSGDTLDVDGSTLSGVAANPASAFTCIEGVREARLAKAPLIGPADRQIELQAWANDRSWLDFAEELSNDALDDIWRFLGHDIPGEGTLIIREAPEPEAGGYAGAHDTPGVVTLDERGGTEDVEHQMAHAWFGKDNVRELWLREGIAEWIATSVSGEACAPVVDNGEGLDLSQWQILRPTAPSDYETIMEEQKAAACGIVSALAERMPLESFKQEVLGSLLLGETKYIGSAGPEIGASPIIDYREWLDAIDERGLIAAAKADPAFAGNLDDLDFAQNLLDDFGAFVEVPQMQLRSQARAMYHEFLAKAAPLGAPRAVRKDMDDWNFERAIERIEQSNAVYDSLVEADRLLEEADLFPIVQPLFEAAADEAELDAVTEWTRQLLEGATALVTPLGELSDALPPGWSFPAAINNALAAQRFEEVRPAIRPAVDVAEYIREANEFLPQAGILEKYQARFEGAITAAALAQLVDEARSDNFTAQRVSSALEQLRADVGDWTIPQAVTQPIEQGQLEAGLSIVDDASAVVEAAQAADLVLARTANLDLVETGLLEGVQPRFEAVTNGAQMAALREQVEASSAAAVAVGGNLADLIAIVDDWQIPTIITEAVSAGDYPAAVAPAQAALLWVENAAQADESLEELNLLESIRSDFENATELATLTDGAERAGLWARAAGQVSLATEKAAEPRDMLTEFGLWGVDVEPQLASAKQALIEGDLSAALTEAAAVITTIDGGSGAGSLRLAGIIFLGVAIIGVIGLWIILRRQAGPPWARSTTPHWVKDEKRGLLGRGKKKDDKQGRN